MTKKRILFIVSLLLMPKLEAYAAAPADFESLQKVVQDLQSQLGNYQHQVENQTQLIEIQGKEIAELKNQFAVIQQRTERPSYVVPRDQGEFKQNILDVVREFSLLEREETPDEKELRTLYDDGFYLKGKDDTLRIGGWYQGDINIYDRGNEGNTRFRNRRVRLDVRGVLEDYFEYRLFTQFAGSSANLQEAWLMYKYFPGARIKFGQFKVPFSLESQYSSLWTDFIEKSMGVANLEPAEDIGAMLYGNPFGGVIEYAVGTFNGRLRTLEDNNDNLDIAGRLVLVPFKKSQVSFLKELYLGGSMTWGRSDETLASTGFTTAGGSRFLTYATSTRHADDRTRFGAEIQWIYGPGDLKAEYVGGRFTNVERSVLKEDVNVDSWYVSGSYLLTGEKKVRDKWIDPKRDFSLADGGWGAWEAAVRFEQFFVNDSPFASGIVTGVDRVDAYTVGLNWWPNRHIRLMFNYTLNDFSGPLLLGAESEDSEHLWLGRAQYQF